MVLNMIVSARSALDTSFHCILRERDDGIEFVIAVRVGFLFHAAKEHWLLAVLGRLWVVA